MSQYEDIIRRLKHETIYLLNSYDEVVMKLLPGEDAPIYARFAGKKEYRISHNTNLVAETLLEANEISKQEYDNY